MEPTLYERQRLVIEKISYHLHAPRRGDIVVLHAPDGGDIALIKRVIGLPGETIEVRNGQVLINSRPLQEPYLRTLTNGVFPLTPIPDDAIFVMGDNRDRSRDSRTFGPVPIEDVVASLAALLAAGQGRFCPESLTIIRASPLIGCILC